MAFDEKLFLSWEGLQQYDELIKKWHMTQDKKSTDALKELIQQNADAIADNGDAIADLQELIGGEKLGEGEKDILTRIAELEDSTADADALQALKEELFGKEAEGTEGEEGYVPATPGAIETAKQEAIEEAEDYTDAKIGDLKVTVKTTDEEGNETSEEKDATVKEYVDDAIKNVIDGAPEILDTLKEIADWIANDETGTANLIERVAANEDAIEVLNGDKDTEGSVDQKIDAESQILRELIQTNANDITDLQNDFVDLKEYVDTQDKAVYDSIQSVQSDRIAMLFAEDLVVEDGQSVAEALIEAMAAGTPVALTPDMEITENIDIPATAVVKANGATFSGDVTISKDATVEGAIFTGTVTID